MKISSFFLILSLISQASLAYEFDIPPPPADHSSADQRDFRILHQYQDERTQEECEIAGRQSTPTLMSFFGPSTGILTKAEFEKVKVYGTKIMEKAFDIAGPFKDLYKRKRPYDRDPTLKPCIRIPGGTRSYPSSHATAGIVLAAALAKKFPAKREMILKQGKQIGINRLIGGVHHPSDVEAGQNLGRQIADHLEELE